MMPELSLNILDIAQNSVAAGASRIEISIAADTRSDRLVVTVSDNGRGMSEEQAARASDPFYTTRTTRRVGLGLPFFEMAAQLTGGDFKIESEPGRGTAVTAVFGLSHIDRMPLGDIAGSFCALVAANPERDFILNVTAGGQGFSADTTAFRAVLGEDVPLDTPEVLAFIKDYINENLAAAGGLD
jgi:anti-sigma regulatory factor (Ser/Thr protein kinase)